jgi:hypothetical protein
MKYLIFHASGVLIDEVFLDIPCLFVALFRRSMTSVMKIKPFGLFCDNNDTTK